MTKRFIDALGLDPTLTKSTVTFVPDVTPLPQALDHGLVNLGS